MKLSKGTAQEIVAGELGAWEEVSGTRQIIAHNRWSVVYTAVFRIIPDDKYYQTKWSIGATEIQGEEPFDYTDPIFIEVEQKEITEKKWVPIES